MVCSAVKPWAGGWGTEWPSAGWVGGKSEIGNPKLEIVLSYHHGMIVEVRIQRLPHAEGLPLPAYATGGAAGADLRAAVESEMILGPGGRAVVPTGLVVEIPAGYEGQVRPRSGLAIKAGLTIVNAPGTIDSDYRGELKVLMINLGSDTVSIGRGDRIAQLLIAPVTRASFVETEALSDSERGDGGFGSTGV
jgi:dUTP pyrophosphatase